ncbi:MAG: hypothetical protein RRZ24_01320 [Clostridia bacterium]
MKKLITLVLCLAMVTATFAGCTTAPATETPTATEAPATTDVPVATEVPVVEPTEAPAAGGQKTGLAVITTVDKSVAAGEKDGKAQADSMIVAVSVDVNGVISRCNIDSAQTAIGFNKDGKLTTDVATLFPSKQELGANYGMAKASAIGKEWNEQIDALAAYCVGKTIDQVKGIAMTETTAPADADLAASCTISIAGYLNAIAKAVEYAAETDAMSGDKLGLGVITNMRKSLDVAKDADGLAQAYSTYAVVTVDANGKITSCIIDASQANVNFDKAGAITSDLTAEVKTKNELGAAYGMAKASAIGKEWNEQAAAFAAYCVGKTADEVKGIAMNDQGLAADADLIASVTVHIGEFMDVVAKAVANAK